MLGLWEDILGSSPQRPQDQIEISRGGGLLDADVAQAASASDSTHTARHQCEPQSLSEKRIISQGSASHSESPLDELGKHAKTAPSCIHQSLCVGNCVFWSVSLGESAALMTKNKSGQIF